MINLYDTHKFAYFLNKKNIPIIPKLVYFFQFLIFNSSVHPKTKIGEGSRFAYGGIGCVIHEDCIIGCNCTIGQSVTLGGNGKEPGVPVIGNNVYISAGARILGPIKIGDNCKIGANAVVITDIPNNTTAVGIPAKIITK